MVAPRDSTWTSWNTSQGPAKSIIVAPSLSTNATGIGPWGGASSAAAPASAASIVASSSGTAQGDHRVDFGCAAGRQEAGERADRGEHRCAGQEGDRVVSGDAEDEPGHDARDDQAARDAQGEP